MKIKKFEYETLQGYRVKMEYLTQRLLNGVCPDVNELRTLCGLQVESDSEPKVEKTIVVEADGPAIKNAVEKLYEDFLDENYEPDKEPPSESIPPPKNIPPSVWVAVPQGKRESTKEK